MPRRAWVTLAAPPNKEKDDLEQRRPVDWNGESALWWNTAINRTCFEATGTA